MLQDPEFLYRIEVGAPTATAGVAKLDQFELASRLSFLIWGSTPDDTLAAEARAGALETEEWLPTSSLPTDEVALLTLNRPERLNAFTEQTKRELLAVLLELSTDRVVRAVVLTGAGRSMITVSAVGPCGSVLMM